MIKQITAKTLVIIITVFLIIGFVVAYYSYLLGVKQKSISIKKQARDFRIQGNERLIKAIELLGNTNSAVRLSGLYDLEQILKDSPEVQNTVIEFLSAYIREKTNKDVVEENKSNQSFSKESTDDKINAVTTEVQTAISILARRPKAEEWNENIINSSEADLRYLNIIVDLHSSDLRNANFNRADLRNANLANVNLSEADLREADLREADLSGANLRNATLRNANLRDANLSGANLSNATFISTSQLEEAFFDYIFVIDKKLDRKSALKWLREK